MVTRPEQSNMSPAYANNKERYINEESVTFNITMQSRRPLMALWL